MGNAIEVVHEDGRRARMSPTWLAKAGGEMGWRAVTADDAPTAKSKAPRARKGSARTAKQDVPTTVEDGPSTSEEE